MDKIFYSTRIDTIVNGTISGAVGVTGNRISYIGPRAEAKPLISKHTEEIDLGDAFLMPGLIEGHTHMFPYRKSADLSQADSISACGEILRSFHEKNPDLPLIYGHDWFAANWGGRMPGYNDIDPYLPDIPFFAPDMDVHRIWLNSAMMHRIGLSKDTINSFSKGRPEMVATDSEGNPTGLIEDEVAMDLLLREAVEPDYENVTRMFEVWTHYGVTAINDMDFFTSDNKILKMTGEMEKKGSLYVRVFSSLDATQADADSIEEGKSFMKTDIFHLNALKSFLDGTGAGRTAFMLKPYKSTDSYGSSYRTLEELKGFIRLADQHGLATHFHACGDAAVRQAIEAYEWALSKGIPLSRRHSIEHLDTVLPEDIDRIRDLGITVNMTPDFLAPTRRWKDNPYIRVYDDDVVEHELFSLGSFVRSGINVSFGTDATASSMNPADQLFRSIARVADDYEPNGGFRSNEAIRIDQALFCYTMGSARSIGMEKKLGSLEVGKYADLSAWDTDFLRASKDKIKKAKPILTVSDGRTVYRE